MLCLSDRGGGTGGTGGNFGEGNARPDGPDVCDSVHARVISQLLQKDQKAVSNFSNFM